VFLCHLRLLRKESQQLVSTAESARIATSFCLLFSAYLFSSFSFFFFPFLPRGALHTPNRPNDPTNNLTYTLDNRLHSKMSAKPSSNSSSHQHLSSDLGFSTKAIHVGSEPHLSASNGVTPSLDMSTTYLQNQIGNFKFEYSRSSNPTRLALERQLAALEGADVLLKENLKKEGIDEETFESGPAALALASGSAATATVIQAITQNGGHIVSVGDVYGGTSRFMVKVAKQLSNVETSFVDMSYTGISEEGVDGESEEQRREREDQTIVDRVEAALKSDTKVSFPLCSVLIAVEIDLSFLQLIWAETPTNPMLSLVPIRLLASIAQRRNIPLVIDNTFSSTYLTQPLLLGATVVVGSSTKYVGGHSDVLGGYLVTASPCLLAKFRFLQNAHGAVPSPFDSWLLIRSLKTLALRIRQHSLNGLATRGGYKKPESPLDS